MPLNIDANPRNADWTKQSWDLLDIDSIEKLQAYLKAQGISVEHFKQLPLYTLNVDKLKWLQKL